MVNYLDNDDVIELLEWLKGKKYLINEKSCTMTEQFETEHSWQLSRNTIINEVVKKIFELV